MKTSNMDYEKKYKVALDKIRSLHRDYNQISTLIDVKEELENIFPELKEHKESEDEKIKQELIEYHKAQAFLDGKPNNKHVKFVAWLEKQGEQMPAWSEDDEAWLNDIIDDAKQGAELDSQQIDWLKSLKDRVQPKQK